MKKKGLSTIVATIAVVLLTLAAAAFIAGFIVPLVRNQLNEGTECLGYEDYFTFYEEFEYNCYRQGGSTWLYGISVQADSVREETADEVAGFKLQFLKTGESKSVEVEDEMPKTDEIRMLNSSVAKLEIPKSGEVRTYVYTGNGLFGTVKIAPVLKSGRTCEITDSIDIGGIECAPGVDLALT
ncbi:MAG: hypothetical protein KJ600_04590 [Nanoarchaeota archaeon]|nr:hypothetical protein [Nanoarchaeota archaeon]MBU1103806.1 hypothetical protein [Nanoarchaeota archaeon]